MADNRTKEVVRRTWHENGTLATEYTLVDRLIVGSYREWHDNGVLAKEEPFVGGKVHGTVRQWNREGKLLGEYTMTNGCGVKRTWSEDGSPATEFERVSEHAARGKVWDDLGKAREVFLWNGKPISKMKFHERLATEANGDQG